jgi:hypothetical protein
VTTAFNSLQTIFQAEVLAAGVQQLGQVGIVGHGFAGRTFHAPLTGVTPGLALSVVASQDPLKVRADLPNSIAQGKRCAPSTGFKHISAIFAAMQRFGFYIS